jgi:hypothetical protein
MNNPSPEESNGNNPQDYDPLGGISSPDELKNILIGFMGQTYTEVSKFDKHLVSPNVTLRPKSAEFHNIAEKLLSEANQIYGKNNTQTKNNVNENHVVKVNIPVPRFDLKPSNFTVAIPDQNLNPYDPNQMEFNFDRSATAESIQKKLDDIMLKLCAIQDRLDKLNPKPSEY